MNHQIGHQLPRDHLNTQPRQARGHEQDQTHGWSCQSDSHIDAHNDRKVQRVDTKLIECRCQDRTEYEDGRYGVKEHAGDQQQQVQQLRLLSHF